ncbi:MAG TPA: CpXC domain-containing protein [Kofleriaceae bacterium]|nr:CpXC domain-containing protein [Kofleriaceae bacterium]
MIKGTARVRCPGCGTEQDVALVQSINTRTDRDAKQRLVAGELNILACACGKRTQLVATLVFHDPDADFYAQVVPGGPDEMAKAGELLQATLGPGTSTRRLVPTQNALLEKVKILDAGLADWAIEMMKVLLLASLGDGELARVLLFDRIEPANDTHPALIHWVLFDEQGREPRAQASPIAQYEKLVSRAAPGPDELQIDRAWAVAAVRAMIEGAN